MSNLLPAEEKLFVKREYRSRILVVGLSFLLATFVAGLLFSFPSFMISRGRVSDALQKKAEIQKSIASAEKENVHEEFRRTREKIKLLNLSEDTKGRSLPLFIERIDSDRSGQVTVDSFSIERNSPEESVLVIAGRADSRSALLSFIERLRKESGVTSVENPISNFAESKDIDFTITIHGTYFRP